GVRRQERKTKRADAREPAAMRTARCERLEVFVTSMGINIAQESRFRRPTRPSLRSAQGRRPRCGTIRAFSNTSSVASQYVLEFRFFPAHAHDAAVPRRQGELPGRAAL